MNIGTLLEGKGGLEGRNWWAHIRNQLLNKMFKC